MTCVEKREFFFFFYEGGLVVCSRESWDGEEEGEIREERVGRVVNY